MIASQRGHMSWKKLERRLPRRGRGHRPPPPLRINAFIAALVALVLVASLGGCATTQSQKAAQARGVVTAFYRVEGVGWEGLQVFDDAKKADFKVRAAPVAEFDDYVEGRKRVELAFVSIRHLTNTADDSITAFEKGTVKDLDWIRLLAALLEGARGLRDAAKAIGFEIPGLADLIGRGP